MAESDEPKTGELRQTQEHKVTEERELAERASEPAEERQHERRADKAAYLKEKLAERERAERDAE
jgi:hypothetical protein